MGHDPNRCAGDVFKTPAVAVLSCSKDTAEALCIGLTHVTGSKVDWHFIGGRVVIRCLGDRDKVREILAGVGGVLKIQGYTTDDEGNAQPLVNDMDLIRGKQ